MKQFFLTKRHTHARLHARPVTGCKSHMLGLAPPVFVAGSWNYSPKEVKCDLECMTPECGYDFGGCDDELAVTGFNKIDFEMYLAFIVSTYLTLSLCPLNVSISRCKHQIFKYLDSCVSNCLLSLLCESCAYLCRQIMPEACV